MLLTATTNSFYVVETLANTANGTMIIMKQPQGEKLASEKEEVSRMTSNQQPLGSEEAERREQSYLCSPVSAVRRQVDDVQTEVDSKERNGKTYSLNNGLSVPALSPTDTQLRTQRIGGTIKRDSTWGIRINREIEETQRECSVVSDPTGFQNDRLKHLLREAISSSCEVGKGTTKPAPCPKQDQQHSNDQGNDQVTTIATEEESRTVESPPLSPTTLRERTEEDVPHDIIPVGKTENDLSKPSARRDRLDKEDSDLKGYRSISITESDVESVDGLPSQVRLGWQDDSRRETILMSLDGIQNHKPRVKHPPQDDSDIKESGHVETTKQQSPFFAWPFNLFWTDKDGDESNETEYRKPSWREDDSLGLLGCSDIIHRRPEPHQPMTTSFIRVSNQPLPSSYANIISQAEVDPRMPDWVDHQFLPRDRPPVDGSYYLGKSRTVIVHEIFRGDWTWCTAWSPDGNYLAIGTENHHLAVVDTISSTVWRVRHDERVTGPARSNTTRSIRAIAWGKHFIAIGGSGNAVTLLTPTVPYAVVHTIEGTGFVGSLSWKGDSAVLAIASRLEKAMIVRIRLRGNSLDKKIHSDELHSFTCKNWVNAIAFSPDGSYVALADSRGNLLVYNYNEGYKKKSIVRLIKSFTLDDSVLDLAWSYDGKWLYAGGEDFKVTVVDTSYWQIVHAQDRKRWVQCIAPSHGGTHVAVGGVSSEMSLLDVRSGWESTMGLGLKGLVPLSASWHPKDQYLALTGQSDSILIMETTNARHVRGHHLHSISPVKSIEFSPDGRMAIVGNDVGVVTIFALSGSTFETAYEMVITLSETIITKWSSNGKFVAVGSRDALTIVCRRSQYALESETSPPNSAGFSIQKVLRDFGEVHTVSIDSHSHFLVVGGGSTTWILDALDGFATVGEWKTGESFASAWSADGRWLAVMGKRKTLTIYNTFDRRVARWGPVFSVQYEAVGRCLAWGPVIAGGLLYLAVGGDNCEVTVLEIRTFEGTWETVLRVPRSGTINELDWSSTGLLAAAIGDGTVSIIDVSYLQSGVAVNEMDYTWQRQALTCFTEIRRNKGQNSMHAVRWIPSAPGSDNLLAIGGTDGELEIVDLTERSRCRGYVHDD